MMPKLPTFKLKLALAEICFAVLMLLYWMMWKIGFYGRIGETYTEFTNASDDYKTIIGVELFALVAIVLAPICWFAFWVMLRKSAKKDLASRAVRTPP